MKGNKEYSYVGNIDKDSGHITTQYTVTVTEYVLPSTVIPEGPGTHPAADGNRVARQPPEKVH